MSEYQETGNVTVSAMKADMSCPTARKYLDELQVPNELQAKHTWRTREDCLVAIWPQAVVMLEEAPDLEAKALFEYLWERSPWAVQEKHLRTFQRRVKLWRLQYGPDQEVFFPQDWEAGRAMQLDWTNANELAITIGGQPYEHLLCHSVLPHFQLGMGHALPLRIVAVVAPGFAGSVASAGQGAGGVADGQQ